MVNTLKLKAAMVEKGFTQKTIAKELEIAPATFFNKLHNRNEFSAHEIACLCELLSIQNKDVYFFTHQCEFNSN